MVKPHQIVALDLGNKSLYGEVIEVIKKRSLCWFRPILLVDKLEENFSNLTTEIKIYDLRYTSDLLWRESAFRSVLDTEYIEYLVTLEDFYFNDYNLTISKEKLHIFIQEICQKKS